MLKPIFIEARDLPDAWFLCLWEILDHGRKYKIDRGSYAGQERLEFDYVTVHIKYPGTRPLLPDIPPNLGIPNPVAEGYLEEYLPYLMTDNRPANTVYSYGERLTAGAILYDKNQYAPCDIYGGEINQIDECIKMLKNTPNTNQAILQVGQPGDCLLDDPPCLRHVDIRVYDGKLHFFIYFRSWDLYGGFPSNLGGLQILKEYMAAEIDVQDGEIIAASKGLHLYDYAWDLAKLRTCR